MKKRTTILPLLLIVLCVAALIGYQLLDRIRRDTKAPEITMDSQVLALSVADPEAALLQGMTATDERDGNVTDSMVVERITMLDSIGRASVSYAAFDAAGNVAKASREILYTDYQAPRFTLQAPLLYRYGTSFDILSTIGATDALDGDIQHRIRATALDENAITALGSHDVQFQVTNSMGDTVSLVIPVEVYDPQAYTASLTLNNYLVYLKTGDSFRPAEYLDTFTLMGEETKLGGRLPADYALATVGTVQTDTPGTYPVEYRVTYTERNTNNPLTSRKYTGYSKLIVVVEG